MAAAEVIINPNIVAPAITPLLDNNLGNLISNPSLLLLFGTYSLRSHAHFDQSVKINHQSLNNGKAAIREQIRSDAGFRWLGPHMLKMRVFDNGADMHGARDTSRNFPELGWRTFSSRTKSTTFNANLECFNMPGRSAMRAKHAGILGLAGLASTDGERREEARRDKLQ
ncbi:hypothetical protein [Candidatus Halocynthiibacter alkanivorans]|uniref:hypothetical protein n=1 Tax=Candidatus Halocynthiibacter alkanivorans TaxID=2267619 RepID=UPI00190F618C|nr:hypothetical protein [Candidatus Halocynthiibacter alkanivorans]